MLVKFMVAYENEGTLNTLPKVFDSFDDANDSAKEHEERNPAFVFMVCKVVPAIRDTAKDALIAACKEWKEYMENNGGAEDNTSYDRCVQALEMTEPNEQD